MGRLNSLNKTLEQFRSKRLAERMTETLEQAFFKKAEANILAKLTTEEIVLLQRVLANLDLGGLDSLGAQKAFTAIANKLTEDEALLFFRIKHQFPSAELEQAVQGYLEEARMAKKDSVAHITSKSKIIYELLPAIAKPKKRK